MRFFRSIFAITVLAGAAAAHAQSTPRDSLLVSRQWLADHLHDRNLVLLHVGPKPGYDTLHIAGSVFTDLQALDARTTLALELPTADSLKAWLERHGVSDNSRIVVVPGNGWFSPATRLILTLDHAGFGNRTSMLDGGTTGWVRENRPTTRDVPTITPGKVSPLKLKRVTVSAEDVRDRKPGTTLIDARAASFYDGVEAGGNGTVQKNGHIPGAKSIPYLSVLENGDLLPAAALAEKFKAAGVTPGGDVIAYCHIGQQATLVVFAARTLGYNVKLFDGSFEDWAVRGWPVEMPVGK